MIPRSVKTWVAIATFIAGAFVGKSCSAADPQGHLACAGAIADSVLTHVAINKHYDEGNPILGHHPQPWTLAASAGLRCAAFEMIGKGDSPAARYALLGLSMIQLAVVGNNTAIVTKNNHSRFPMAMIGISIPIGLELAR